MAGKISKILVSYSSSIIFKELRYSKLPAVNLRQSISHFGTRREVSALCYLLQKRMASTQSDDGATATPATVEMSNESRIMLDSEKLKHNQVEAESESSDQQQLAASSSPSIQNSNDGADDVNEVKTEEAKPFRLGKKIKAAVLLSYSGQGYYGMQIQSDGTKTIETDLMKAFFDARMVDDEGFAKPKSIKFQRAARTDKNVSAARNIVSILVPKNFDPEVVNKHLPDQIRVMDFRRVTKSFDAKLQCNSRTYLYMIPTFAFTPLDMKVQEDYRITPEVMEKVRHTLKLYEGTKNFHNFTSRKKPTDPSANRFIMSFTSTDPFVKEGLEYVVLMVKGQSFMLHQIRKMIGLVVAMLRGFANEETMRKCFTLERIDIPMVPGLGLMLGEAHYDSYNRKFGRDGVHEPLVWDNVEEKIARFCQEKIYTNVTRTENEEKSMFQWLSTVPYHTYDGRDLDRPGNFGPLGKAFLHVKKDRGELSDEEEVEIDDLDSDDEQPRKKMKQDN